MAGWGGAFALAGGNATGFQNGSGMLLTFALNAKQPLPETNAMKLKPVAPLEFNASPQRLDAGAGLFAQWCASCHGFGAVGGGATPDLRYSSQAVFDNYAEIVLEGKRSSQGMPSFKQGLNADDIEAIRVYVLKRRSELAGQK